MNRKSNNKSLFAMFLFVLSFIFSVTHGATRHVPSQYSTIQPAINASSHGDTIIVADGTYIGAGNWNIDFKGKKITVRSANGPENCIIDCQNSGRGFFFHRGESNDSVIDGLTIMNGTDVSTAQGGGGIYCRDNSNPVIKNCFFIKNHAGKKGGGGIATAWGASPVIRNCIFIENTAKYGGAIDSSHGIIEINNCIFIGNSGQYCGGLRTHTCTATVKNSMFISNIAESGGGIQVIYTDLNLSNCTIYGNSAETYGGGISIQVGSVGIINNCIFWLNTAVEGPEIANKFFSSAPYPSTVSIFYSDIQGGVASVHVDPQCTLNWGTGNINKDPLFVNASGGNYHLLAHSPCINAGDPSVNYSGQTDIDSAPRVIFDRVDMGADEYGNTIILAPNGGELFLNGKSYFITWQGLLDVSEVVIEYSVNNGLNWTVVDPPNIGNTGNYEWTVPNVQSMECLVRVSDPNSPEDNDTSDGMFTILTAGPDDIVVPMHYDTIQGAIDAASEGQTVIVAPKVYTGLGNRDLDFKGKAITVRSVEPDNPEVVEATIIHCQGSASNPHRGFYFHNNEDANSVLKGFTVTNGYGPW
jgi:hypothetical protein